MTKRLEKYQLNKNIPFFILIYDILNITFSSISKTLNHTEIKNKMNKNGGD